MNRADASWRHFALTAALVCVGILSALPEEPKLYVLWDTVSPDGKYAIAWSTTSEAYREALPLPNETHNNPVTNYVIEVASRKIVVPLPQGHYWDLYGQGRPNHFSLETVWSVDSRLLLAIYNSRWSTDRVFLVDVSVPRAVRIEHQLAASSKQVLNSRHGSKYAIDKDNLAITFTSPLFLATGRLYITANASIPEQRNFDFGLYFRITNGGTSVTLGQSKPLSGEESSDRFLYRAYLKLYGLLSPADQKSLVEEERGWLTKREAIKSDDQKEAFTVARTEELQARLQNILMAKERR
jgi:hypothetical protein